MRLMIIRHGDPDYAADSLTEKGRREAELLSRRLAPMEIRAFYCSPMGRAKDTAAPTLKKVRRRAEILPWLREFDVLISDEKTGEKRIPWDWLPADWTSVPEFYDRDRWSTVPVMRRADVGKAADRVGAGLDEILKRHGYERDGNLYRAVCPNRDTVVLFCHFGVECVMLGHLLGISPMILWHGFCALPSSVTTLYTEERRRGTAYFRVAAFGDTAHLYAAGEPPAFTARFCETFDCAAERRD